MSQVTNRVSRAIRAPRAERQHKAVSASVARLLAQVQAEAQQALLEELSAKDGVTVLQPLEVDDGWARGFSDFHRVSNPNGACLTLVRRRQFPDSWGPHMTPIWHPSYYWIDLDLRDGMGRTWSTDLGRHVVDDFGALVCIEGSAK